MDIFSVHCFVAKVEWFIFEQIWSWRFYPAK